MVVANDMMLFPGSFTDVGPLHERDSLRDEQV
jgi:hypothetical protein